MQRAPDLARFHPLPDRPFKLIAQRSRRARVFYFLFWVNPAPLAAQLRCAPW